MKRLKSGIIMMIGLSATASAMAQLITPTVGHSHYVSNVQAEVKNPAFHSFHIRMRQVLERIEKDLKSNKITQSQAADLQEKVKAVRVQEISWIKSSETRSLTSEQITQLNQQLDTIAAEL